MDEPKAVVGAVIAQIYPVSSAGLDIYADGAFLCDFTH
jgi:hypothetical protein